MATDNVTHRHQDDMNKLDRSIEAKLNAARFLHVWGCETAEWNTRQALKRAVRRRRNRQHKVAR